MSKQRNVDYSNIKTQQNVDYSNIKTQRNVDYSNIKTQRNVDYSNIKTEECRLFERQSSEMLIIQRGQIDHMMPMTSGAQAVLITPRAVLILN